MLRNLHYVYGPRDLQVPARLNFGEYMLQKMYEAKEKIAFTNAATHKSLTYGQIVQEAMNFSVSLTHLGLKKGQTVAICTENRMEFWSVVLGVASAGAVLSTINSGYLEEELKHVINISKPVYVVLSPNCYKQHGKFFRSQPQVKGIILFGDQRTDDVILYNDLVKAENGNGNVIVNNRLARNVKYEEFAVVDVDGQTDTLFILYSSGTTGLPKGVMLTHLNILAHCFLPIFYPVEPLTLIITPWFHVMGLVSTLVAMVQCRHFVYLSKFEMNLFLRTIERYKIGQTILVPAVILALSKTSSEYDLSSVESIMSGGAPFPKESLDLVKSKFPNVKGVFQGYGMTEVGLAVTKFFLHEQSTVGVKKVGSVGKAVPGNVIKVVDLETRRPLGPNQHGELCVKGVAVMKGYVGKSRTEDFDDEGFYKTGDVGYYDQDGCFYIVDRLKELIKYKGYQVAPAELEALLIKHEAIRDAGVIGVPDATAGEVPLAFVVKQPGKNVTEKEIKDYVAKKLSNPKQLRGGVRFVDAIPRNPSGKILRKVLRQMVKSQNSKL